METTEMPSSDMPTAAEIVTAMTSSAIVYTQSTVSATTMKASEGKTTPENLHYAMSAVIGPIICLLGMMGNILALIVWNRPGMVSSTGRYLTAQAVADFGVLLFFILCDSAKAWNPALVNQMSYGVFFCYIGYPLFFFFIIASIWITVGVTIDRYIMVCWIAKAKEFCNTKRANFGIFLISVNCFLINIPHFMSFRIMRSNTTDMTFEMTEFEKGDGGKFYEFWIHCIVLILIPWFSVFAMNMKIIKQIGKSNRRMADKKNSQSIKKSKQSENQVTRLLLGVTFSFLFFIGVQCVVQCLYMQKPSEANWDLIDSSFAFAKTGIVFNSSLNFVFYCLMGKRFRLELMSLLGWKRSKDLQSSSLMDSQSTGTTSGTSSTTGI